MKRWVFSALIAAASLACGPAAIPREGDALEVSSLPVQVRQDYALFANRCSKCHSLQRPLALASRGVSDSMWVHYIERMRMQPGSGISASDGAVILRFLKFYSRAEAAKRQEGEDAGAPSSPVPTSPPPPVAVPVDNDGGLQ